MREKVLDYVKNLREDGAFLKKFYQEAGCINSGHPTPCLNEQARQFNRFPVQIFWLVFPFST